MQRTFNDMFSTRDLGHIVDHPDSGSVHQQLGAHTCSQKAVCGLLWLGERMMPGKGEDLCKHCQYRVFNHLHEIFVGSELTNTHGHIRFESDGLKTYVVHSSNAGTIKVLDAHGAYWFITNWFRATHRMMQAAAPTNYESWQHLIEQYMKQAKTCAVPSDRCHWNNFHATDKARGARTQRDQLGEQHSRQTPHVLMAFRQPVNVPDSDWGFGASTPSVTTTALGRVGINMQGGQRLPTPWWHNRAPA